MGENLLAISNLNDFIFCPASIYFHSLDYETDKLSYQDSYQINGTAAHKSVDSSTYTDKKSVLQGIAVYSEKYNLYGKIDLFDIDKGLLIERKKKVKTLYDGYIVQVYAQYFGLVALGYKVNQIKIHSVDDNKSYLIPLPQDNLPMVTKFEKLIYDINKFNFTGFIQSNKEKCKKCIYEPLCSFSTLEVS